MPGIDRCATVTGGHYDTVPVTGGADDNASGTAAVLEVARVAAARGLAGDNCFILFSAEELGLFGSRAYVGSLDDDEITAIRVMLNLDVVGVNQPLGLIGSEDVADVARIEADRLNIDATVSTLPENAGSDHLSFQREGVPVIMFNRPNDLIHTPRDSLDRIDRNLILEAIKVAYATLEALATG
jgi:Zn-dependent M28 family amino/carboxypeptidase